MKVGIVFKNHTAVLICLLALAVCRDPARAETYSWTDNNGNMHFSDNPASVPAARLGGVRVSDDITLSNPEVRRSVEEGRKRAAQIEREDQGRERQRRARETWEEQERRNRELRDKRARDEQERRDKLAAQAERRRLSTEPVQTSGGILWRGGST